MVSSYLQFYCLEENNRFNSEYIYEKLFDKKVDKRYLLGSIHKFIKLNKDMLDFIGVEVQLLGSEQQVELNFKTSSKIGAIPLRMPYDGISRKDLQILPRYQNREKPLVELSNILSLLEYSIKPEYINDEKLNNPYQLKPPMYYEAAKYIELFQKANNYCWVKFESVENNHRRPKSGTKWLKYAMESKNPQKSLIYPAEDNILSQNHTEWQELRFVFDIAKNLILNQSVPARLRYKYEPIVKILTKLVDKIKPKPVKQVKLHANDPVCIKNLKEQALVLLLKNTKDCMAWRVDMTVLFERYTQHIIRLAIKGLSGVLYANHKLSGNGNIPTWGLKYLEPDIMVRFNTNVLMADVKYKAHLLNRNKASDLLKESYRHDLHQLLAYCSFEPHDKKIGVLFYPDNDNSIVSMEYLERISVVRNKVLLIGIPFSSDQGTIDASVDFIKKNIRNAFESNGNKIC